MSSNIDTSSDSRPGGIGPGDRLQAARIEQGLSVEDIANKMHLSLGILKSIEENNFDDITAPIFVKGYLRAYARIVSLNEEEMIQHYVEFYSDEDPPITSTSSTSPEISSADARVKWTTYIVILILCGLLGAWWWSNDQKRDESISLDVDEPVVEQETVAEVNIVGNQDEIIAASDSDRDSDAMNVESVQGESEATIALVEKQAEALDEMQVIAGTAGPTDSNNEPSLPDNEPEQVVEGKTDIDTSIEVSAENSETVAEVTSESTEQIIEQGQLPSGEGDVIKLIIHADTWADIKDSEGNRLAYDLLRADRQLTLTGQAPFSVFFGNGHGVEMTYNNEAVDIASHIRSDNTARLKIGTN